MTSRERVLAALNHTQPDRVPIDLSGHRSSGIAAMAYAKLRDYLAFENKPIRVYDPVQQLAIVDDDVLDLFGVDTIELGRAFALEDNYWTEWQLPDGVPCLMPVWAKPKRRKGEWILPSKTGRPLGRMPDGVLYFEQCHFPLMENDAPDQVAPAFEDCMWTAFATPPGPIVDGPRGQKLFAEGARRLRSQTDRAILGLFGGNLLEIGQYFYRNDNFFMLLAGEPQKAHRFLDQLLEIHLQNLAAFLDAVGDFIDVIVFGDDFGMQQGPQISPSMYREFFKPRQAVMWAFVKAKSRAKVMLHCCGGVRELLDDMIGAGLDAINPVQISCRGMEAEGLKKDFGNRLTFWGGGCDTRQILCEGTPEEVREHVRRNLEIWNPAGGYVFQQVHNLMANVPPANVVAMFEAVQEFLPRS